MKQITFTLNEPQAQALALLINQGVSAVGAQIAQGGAAALKEGSRVLVQCDQAVDVINTAINEAMQADAQAEAPVNRKERRAADAKKGRGQ